MKKIPHFLFLLLIAFIFLPGKSFGQQSERVILGGYKLEPTVATSGSGVVAIELQNDTLRVQGDFSYLTSPYYGAYIMMGEKGEAGNQLFRLKVDLNEERTGGVLKADKNTFALSQAQKNLLQSGKLYIIIASDDHPTGEIGGRIEF